MKETRILGLLIRDRIKEAGQTQKILGKYAHVISTRLGFHELNDNACSRAGIILLQLTGHTEDWTNFEHEISAIEGIELQKMSFTY